MTFSVGDYVRIKKLGKIGEIIEVIKPGIFRVALGTMNINCQADELEVAKKEKSKHNDIPPPAQFKVISDKRTSRSLEQLDLHGMTVNDAMHAFEEHLNKAILAGMDGFAVVHGHGTGRVKQALLNYLQTAAVVRSFKADVFNPGMMRIYL